MRLPGIQRPAVSLAFGLTANAVWLAPLRAEPAEEPPPSYSLSWVRGNGAEQCPDRRELAREIESRLGWSVFVSGAPRSLEVHVFRSGGTLTSAIYLRDAQGGLLGSRVLDSDDSSCDSIFSATVLAAALVIDPEAELVPTPPDVTVRPPSSAPPELPTPRQPPSCQPCPRPRPMTPPTLQKAQPRPPERSAVCGRERSADNAAAVSLGAAASAAVLPGFVPGLVLSVEPRLGTRWTAAMGALYFVPSEAEARRAATFRVGLSALSVGVGLDALRTSRQRLALKAGLLVGALHASVVSPIPSDPGDYLFLAADAGMDAEVTVWGGWFLGLRGRVVVPMLRRAFLVQGSDQPVWRQPLAGGFASIGAGLVFR